MTRLRKSIARRALLKVGPWVDGSAHGYPTVTVASKYGSDRLAHCLFCFEDHPFHREYCPWDDYFVDAKRERNREKGS